MRAQSGRNENLPKKPSGGQRPDPPRDPDLPNSTPATDAETPLIFLIIVNEPQLPRNGATARALNSIRNKCVKRLSQSSEITVTAGEELSRPEAIRRAHAETKAYVVWLQLNTETNGNGHAATNDAPAWTINYVIFAPRTAQIKAEGSVSQSPTVDTGGGKDISSASAKTKSIEQAFQTIGYELANQIAHELGLAITPERV